MLFFVSLNEYRVANPNDLTQQGAEGTAHQYGPTRSQQSKDGLGEMLGGLERDTQLLVPVYDYCMPDKECACGDGCEDPCALFRNISFPVGEFFPPNTVKRPESCDDIKSCCK